MEHKNKKIIIPMPWRHVVTMYLFFSEEQINFVVAAAVTSVTLLGVSTWLNMPWKIFPLLAVLVH